MHSARDNESDAWREEIRRFKTEVDTFCGELQRLCATGETSFLEAFRRNEQRQFERWWDTADLEGCTKKTAAWEAWRASKRSWPGSP